MNRTPESENFVANHTLTFTEGWFGCVYTQHTHMRCYSNDLTMSTSEMLSKLSTWTSTPTGTAGPAD